MSIFKKILMAGAVPLWFACLALTIITLMRNAADISLQSLAGVMIVALCLDFMFESAHDVHYARNCFVAGAIVVVTLAFFWSLGAWLLSAAIVVVVPLGAWLVGAVRQLSLAQKQLR